MSAGRLRDNARVLEDRAARPHQIPGRPREAGEGPEQARVPTRDAAETAAGTGDDTRSGYPGPGRLPPPRARGSARVSANASDVIRLTISRLAIDDRIDDLMGRGELREPQFLEIGPDFSRSTRLAFDFEHARPSLLLEDQRSSCVSPKRNPIYDHGEDVCVPCSVLRRLRCARADRAAVGFDRNTAPGATWYK